MPFEDQKMARSCLLQPDLVVVVLLAYTKQIAKNMSKNSFLSQFISRRHRTRLHP